MRNGLPTTVTAYATVLFIAVALWTSKKPTTVNKQTEDT